jgi:hypothetical protein
MMRAVFAGPCASCAGGCAVTGVTRDWGAPVAAVPVDAVAAAVPSLAGACSNGVLEHAARKTTLNAHKKRFSIFVTPS